MATAGAAAATARCMLALAPRLAHCEPPTPSSTRTGIPLLPTTLRPDSGLSHLWPVRNSARVPCSGHILCMQLWCKFWATRLMQPRMQGRTAWAAALASCVRFVRGCSPGERSWRLQTKTLPEATVYPAGHGPALRRNLTGHPAPSR